jgi:hypothetical protein
MVTTLLQDYHANIDMETTDGETIASEICIEEELPDQEKFDAILFLLENSADANRGLVLHLVANRYSQDVRSKSEFQDLFHRIVTDYDANVNFCNERNVPFLQTVFDGYYDYRDDQRSMLSLQDWSDHFNGVFKTFQRYSGDVNAQQPGILIPLLPQICNTNH